MTATKKSESIPLAVPPNRLNPEAGDSRVGIHDGNRFTPINPNVVNLTFDGDRDKPRGVRVWRDKTDSLRGED
jgi:hypothetical protein